MIDESATPTRPRPLTVKAFGVTDTGKVRTHDEDQFLIAELTRVMRVWQTSLQEPELQVGEERAHLFLVADGMGGHRAGERASALAVAAIEQFTLDSLDGFSGRTGPKRREFSRSSSRRFAALMLAFSKKPRSTRN